MIFHPQHFEKQEGFFSFRGDVCAVGHPVLNKPVFKELWKNFTYQSSTLTLTENDTCFFTLGKAQRASLDGCDYSIVIEPNGLCVCAKSEAELIRGFMTLLDRFQAVDLNGETVIRAECGIIRESAVIPNRMVHFCIFPETELWELRRFVRFCGVLKYTHIVLEFWGMLQYDCMKELAWSNGFTKEQIRPIIAEAKDLGMEIIPMFNHWGHATAGRVMHGKHVVLDQNPSLQTYFSEDGWCWDIRLPKVRALLRQIRLELIDLCGEGSYFHIGCDEAYNYEFGQENMHTLCDFINEINGELALCDRRAIIWGDMLLYRYPHYAPSNKYTCNAPTPEVERFFLEGLDKRIVIADWQYRAPVAPVETCAVFKKAGFDCLLCPWDEGKPQIDAALATVRSESLMGYMHTTWHTLSLGMPYVILMGIGGYGSVQEHTIVKVRPYTAALLRKVWPVNGDYERAGWSKRQVGFRW